MAAQATPNPDVPTETHTLTSPLQSLSVSNQISNASIAPRAQSNLPLPRELRDQIYGYLLHHEYIQDRPYSRRNQSERGEYSKANHREDSVAPTYRFHTAILAVNQEIYAEASEALQSNNFIVVSHRWNLAGALKHQHDVAIVTENHNHIARFRQHKLRIHFQLAQPGEANRKLELFLMISKNLPDLCRFLHWILSLVPSTSYFVTQLRTAAPYDLRKEVEPPERLENGGVPTLKLQLQGHVERRIAKSLLEPFSNVIFGNLDIKMLNTGDVLKEHVRSLKARMSPRVIWTNAMAWHLVCSVRDMKAREDKVLGSGNELGALSRYRIVEALYQNLPILQLPDSTYDSDTAQPFGILASILIMAAITHTLVEIGRGHIIADPAARRLAMIDELAERVLSLPGPEKDTTHLPYTFMRWHAIICRFLVWRTEQGLHRALSQMRVLASDAAGEALGVNIHRHIEYDLRLIELCAGDREARRDYLEPGPSGLREHCRGSSAGHGNFLLLTIPQHNTTKPDGLDGYIDINSYERIRANNPGLAAELV